MSELKLQQCRLDGRYDVLECLGRGSYAEVYRARDAAAHDGSPQIVVIKALNLMLQGAVDAELERTLIDNFRNEAVALDRVRHPNVINRLGHGTAIDLAGQTFHYLVLEYLPGGDMAALCRNHPLALDQAIYYLEQVAAGLAHAHEEHVIHRDIKPQNLLLTADRQTVKIADFGVAKIEAVEGAITRVGTDVYAAPEHHPLRATGPLDASLLASPQHLTPAADVYSLAKTAYMFITGEAPRSFSQQPITGLPEAVASKPWASFVLRVLRRATETNATARYQSVLEFWQELSDATMPQTQLLAALPESDEDGTFVSPGFNPLLRKAAVMPPEPVPAEFAPPPRTAPARNEQDVSAASNDRKVPSGHQAHPARPRIVVPISGNPASTNVDHGARENSTARAQHQPLPNAVVTPATVAAGLPQKLGTATPLPRPVTRPAPVTPDAPTRRARLDANLRRLLIIFLLLAGFALILLGTHRYVQNLRGTTSNSSSNRPATTAANPGVATRPDPPTTPLQTGREMLTAMNVNLRNGPSRTYEKIGEVEGGSRVRLLQVSGNWCEVEVVQRGFPRRGDDEFDRGWVDGTKLK